MTAETTPPFIYLDPSEATTDEEYEYEEDTDLPIVTSTEEEDKVPFDVTTIKEGEYEYEEDTDLPIVTTGEEDEDEEEETSETPFSPTHKGISNYETQQVSSPTDSTITLDENTDQINGDQRNNTSEPFPPESNTDVKITSDYYTTITTEKSKTSDSLTQSSTNKIQFDRHRDMIRKLSVIQFIAVIMTALLVVGLAIYGFMTLSKDLK